MRDGLDGLGLVRAGLLVFLWKAAPPLPPAPTGLLRSGAPPRVGLWLLALLATPKPRGGMVERGEP